MSNIPFQISVGLSRLFVSLSQTLTQQRVRLLFGKLIICVEAGCIYSIYFSVWPIIELFILIMA